MLGDVRAPSYRQLGAGKDPCGDLDSTRPNNVTACTAVSYCNRSD
jgi:hypothetical protein